MTQGTIEDISPTVGAYMAHIRRHRISHTQYETLISLPGSIFEALFFRSEPQKMSSRLPSSNPTTQFVTRSSFSQPHETANVVTTKARDNFFDISETLFAGLSVLIGCLALFVGFLQLRRYRRCQNLENQDQVFELEARESEVRKKITELPRTELAGH